MQNCATQPNNCYPNSELIIAIIDTGLAVSGTNSSPEQSQFIYTNTCDDSGCLLPVNESGNLTFQLTYAKSNYLPTSFLWTNPNEANTPECNDVHGVDMEIYYYNNTHDIPDTCNNENRQKEGIPTDDYGHGTFIAHEIAGAIDDTTSPSVIGITPNVKIMPIKVNVPFRGFFYTDRLAAAILYAVDNGAKIINISAGTDFDSNLVRDAVNYAKNHGVIIVASSGNDGLNSLAYPAAYTHEFENVIAVGALDENLYRAPYSNYEDGYTIYAPVGSNSSHPNTSIVSRSISCSANNSCVPIKYNNTYKLNVSTFNSVPGIGTSFAAPQVTGALALKLNLSNIPPSDYLKIIRLYYLNSHLNVLNLLFSTYSPILINAKKILNQDLHAEDIPSNKAVVCQDFQSVAGISHAYWGNHLIRDILCYKVNNESKITRNDTLFLKDIINKDNHSRYYKLGLRDWDYGYWKTECPLRTFVSGVYLTDDQLIKGIICQAPSDKIAMSFEYHFATPWSHDDRRTTQSKDWSYGYWKGECKDNELLIGVSLQIFKRYLHRLLCVKYEVNPADHRILFFEQYDNRLSTDTNDWRYGHQKSECDTTQAISGISTIIKNKHTDAILCKKINNAEIVTSDFSIYPVNGHDNRGSSAMGDWDYGFWKLQCANDEIMTGISIDPHSKYISGILCRKINSTISLSNNYNTYIYYGHDGRGRNDTGDWNWGNWKGECATNEIAVGVSLNWKSTHYAHKILCRRFNLNH